MLLRSANDAIEVHQVTFLGTNLKSVCDIRTQAL